MAKPTSKPINCSVNSTMPVQPLGRTWARGLTDPRSVRQELRPGVLRKQSLLHPMSYNPASATRPGPAHQRMSGSPTTGAGDAAVRAGAAQPLMTSGPAATHARAGTPPPPSLLSEPPPRPGIGGGETQPGLAAGATSEHHGPGSARQPELPFEPPVINKEGQYGFNITAPHAASRPSMPDTGGVAREAVPPSSLRPRGEPDAYPHSAVSRGMAAEAAGVTSESGINILQPGQVDPTLRAGMRPRQRKRKRPRPARPSHLHLPAHGVRHWMSSFRGCRRPNVRPDRSNSRNGPGGNGDQPRA